ncbi:MAG: hypothetical protein K2Y27_03165 [Xanthobacteraceae bacterium]|nr:hypothetical protein [Xanthobacteraceae bacterium]
MEEVEGIIDHAVGAADGEVATQNVYIVKTVKKSNAVAFDVLDTYTKVEDPAKAAVSINT